MDLLNIGKNIKKLRLKKGFTQSKLAEMAEISTVHMSHIETGSVAMSLDCLLNICNALDTTPNNILLGEYKYIIKDFQNVDNQIIENLTSDEKKLIIEIVKTINELKINRR